MSWQAFSDLSIRNKLVSVILVSTLLSLAAGFTVVAISGLHRLEEDLIKTTEVVARAVGSYSAVALAFDEPQEALNALKPLRQIDNLAAAYVLDTEGRLFEGFSRSGKMELPTELHKEHSEIRDGHVHSFNPIDFDGKHWGTIYVSFTTEPLEQRKREYLGSITLVATLSTILAVLMAYGLQRFISKPILDLAQQTERISSDADYSLRMEKPGEDEIGTLYDGFNNMLGQIRSRQEELERSNRDLDQFAYVASHDLKAPLRAISTLAGWIEEDLDGKIGDESRQQLQLMQSRVLRMDGLIEGILQYSRAGRTHSASEWVDVGEMLVELVELLAPPAGLQILVAGEMPRLQTRRLRLEQVFVNLLSNAIKYHDKETGKIEVLVRRDREFYEFTVADDGPGIDPQHHEKVFQMFQTLQPRDVMESTGVGLSLVNKLVEEEGGQVTLESALGEGCRFRFTWPLQPSPAAG